jgi:hypothetical protein
VPGSDGLAHERYRIELTYHRGLATYRVNERALEGLAELPKPAPDLRHTEVWFLRRVQRPDPQSRPARELHPSARPVVVGRVFDAGSISGDATAWISAERIEN